MITSKDMSPSPITGHTTAAEWQRSTLKLKPLEKGDKRLHGNGMLGIHPTLKNLSSQIKDCVAQTPKPLSKWLKTIWARCQAEGVMKLNGHK